MALDDITATSPSSWRYVSEGGATMVFSYVGPKNDSFDGKVLRLRKGPALPIGKENANDRKKPEEHEPEESDDPVIAFQAHCMSRLIPSLYLPRLETVFVSSNNNGERTGEGGRWLRALADSHKYSRPPSRRNLGGIDVTRRKGVLATDLAGSNEGGMSVEIKPKWSFLPNPAHLSASTRDVKLRTCRFCMHTHLRAVRESQGSNYHPPGSDYCPLDLFSNSQSRVRGALYSLYDTWTATDGKANNLKVFVKGRAIGVFEKLFMLETSDPASSNCVGSDPPTDTSIREAFVNALLPYLTMTPVLRIINRLQRSLDILDIEGLRQLWDQWHVRQTVSSAGSAKFEDTLPIGEGYSEPTLDNWSSFIDEYLSREQQHEHAAKTELPVISSEKEMKFYLLTYLLSATFKDCSIMVRLPTLLDRNCRPIAKDDRTIDPSRVTVIDLDPKNMTRLRKMESLDREIVEVYRETGEGKNCVDNWCC